MTYKLSLAAVVLAFTALEAPANTVSVWNFNGVCSDCPGNGVAELTISQAVQNGPLSFQLAYSSPWISYTLTNANLFVQGTPFSGNSFDPTQQTQIWGLVQDVPITSYGGVGNNMSAGVHNLGDIFFQMYPDGSWLTGPSTFHSDYGVTGSGAWANGPLPVSGVPEPSSYLLMASAGALIAFRARRQTNKV